MMKRWIPLFALAVVMCLFTAADASASCWRCSAGLQQCVYVNHPAWYQCTWNPAEHWCDLEDPCEPYGSPQTVAPLASEYRVEAVETLDETPAPARTAEVTVLEQKLPQQHID
jgi:hypothetical protein